MTLLFFVIVYPLYFVVVASISDPLLVSAGKVWLFPRGLTFAGYEKIFSMNIIWTGYRNTIFYTVCGTTLNVAVTLMAAYALSRKDFALRSFFMKFFVFVFLVHGTLVTFFIIVKSLGMLNKWYTLIILNLVAVYHLVIARSFIEQTIPPSLFDAAIMDGCSHFHFFGRIVVPLSKAIIAVLVLFYGVGHWNDFFNALIFLREEHLQPLQLVLRRILILSEVSTDDVFVDVLNAQERVFLSESIKYGSIVVSSLPVLLMYPFMQKYFLRGVMIGAIKG